MKKILVPTDFSDEAINATEYASKLGQVLEASVTLLHIQSEVPTGEAAAENVPEAILNDTCGEVTRAFQVPCMWKSAAIGERTIAGAISENLPGYDLVVMGTNGAETIVQEMFGTNTWRLSKRTELPVLLVPEGISYGTVKHIAYAFDYNASSELPMKQLVWLAESLNAHIHLMYVPNPYLQESTEEELEAYAEKVMQNAGTRVTLSFNYLYNEDPVKGIDAYMTGNNCQVLALHIHHRNFANLIHRSVSKRITKEAHYPVYLFHR